MKRIITILAIFALIFAFGANMALAAEKKPKEYKLSFITGLSGPLAAAAQTQKLAIELLVEQYNAKGGLNMPWGKIPIKLSVADDEMKLDVGVRRFREAVESGANGVSGSIYNPMSAALNEETKITGTPYMPACVPALDAFKKGNPAPAFMSVAFTPWSIGYLTADALVNGLGKKTFFWQIRPDSWGTVTLQGFEDGIKEFGGKILGVEQLPKGAPDYSAVINKALAAKPDVFITNMFGGDAVACLKQAYDMGLHKTSMLVNSWTTYEVAMGIPAEVAEQMYALTYYYWNMGSFSPDLAARGKALVEDHIKKYGFPPDAYAVLAYTAVDILMQATEKAGSVDGKKVGEVLQTATFNTVKGDASFRKDHQLQGKYLAFFVKGKAASKKMNKYDVFEVIGAYGGDKALPPLKMLGY
jgi:ABC-type branched-subunit amino acid transport system substrate-binding protein